MLTKVSFVGKLLLFYACC